MANNKIKKIDAKESLTNEVLQAKLLKLKKEAMDQRFEHTSGQLTKTHVIKLTRREIARVKTKLNAAA